MFTHTQDTIVAVSSAAGSSPRGILRLSGPRAVEIARSLFTGLPDAPGGFRRYAGCVRWAETGQELPAEAYTFRTPHSYTRQDLVEIHTIGSPPVLAGVLEHAIARGARPAEPGEFTGRAFLAGGMDLTTVEGVAAMIYAGSDAQLRAAEQLLHGSLAKQTQQIQARLADLLALVEASIDFVDEPIDFIAPADAARETREITAALGELLRRSVPMERLDARFRIALAGPPNAGKSTLFNRLTGLDRSICSSVAGTTRDVITAPLSLDGLEAWLMDAAGTCEHAEKTHFSAAEMAERAARTADLVLFVIDGSEELSPATIERMRRIEPARCICVINKCDDADEAAVVRAAEQVRGLGYTPQLVSSRTGQGCSSLKGALRQFVHGQPVDAPGGAILLNVRHRTTIDGARAACDRAHALIEQTPRVAEAAELIAIELREACALLGTIVGAVTTEDVLARIFGRFCIGK